MPLDMLVRIKGQTTEVDTAVDAAETAIGQLGTGIDYSAIGTRIGLGVGNAIKTTAKAGIVGAALAIGDWLLDGINEKLATPEGAEAQGSLDALDTQIDTLRSSIIDPLLPLITELALAAAPLVASLTDVVKNVMPILVPLLGLVAGIVVSAMGGVKDLIGGLNALITAGEGAVKTVADTVHGIYSILKRLLDTIAETWTGITTTLDGIKTKLDELGEPLASALNDLLKLLGLSDETKTAGEDLPGHGGNRTTGSWEAPVYGPPAPQSITINTGADPEAVVRALRRYRMSTGETRFRRILAGPGLAG
jgi:hypothetical protein